MNDVRSFRALEQDQRRGPRRTLAVVLSAVLGVCALGFIAPSAQAADPAAPDHLVIAAVYGSDGGAYNSDWVELYNPTDTAISLGTISGSTVTPSYYQCYRSVTGTSCSSMKLYGTVLAHHYFLVWNGHNAAAGTDRGTPPAGITPDLNFALNAAGTAGSSTDPSGQSNNGFGGYSSGGQILLLDAASGGAYTGTGDLSSAAAKSAGVVDAVGWTKYASPAYSQPGSAENGGGSAVTAASAGPSNSYLSARTFVAGIPQDTDKNASDFTALTTADFTLRSQKSSRVAVAPVSDAEVSRAEAMAPIQVQAGSGVGTLTYAATGLPDGVTIDPSSGVISGTPAASAALKGYPVTVTVSDQTPGQADTATTAFTLTVSSALRVEPIGNVSVHKGAALTPVQVTAHGGTPAYHYAATGLPAGVGIDAGSGTISGTPTGAAGRYGVHVTVTDSAAGGAEQSASVDFTLVERPRTTPPVAGDPLAGLRINEVKAAGTPADGWVELVNTGAAVTGAEVLLVDDTGDSYRVPTQDVAAGGYVVVDGAALGAAGVDLSSTTLDLTETDDTVIDETSGTSGAATSWARYPDGTGDFAVSKRATKGAANAQPAALASDHLVISEVNGDQSGVYDTNWFELYNPTDDPVVLGTIDTTTTPATVQPSFYLCYSATASQTCPTPYKLYGTVYPHHHFLVSIYDAASTTLPSMPAGVTPDIDFGSTSASVNPSQQAAKNIGGNGTGGQMLLLDASVDTTGVYPTATNDTAANDAAFGAPGHVTWSPSAGDFDLADPSVNPSPVVDAMGFSKVDGTNNVHGTEGWSGPAVCAADGSNAASCVHSAPVQDSAHWSERIVKQGFPQDTNDNAADFIVSQRDPISQSSEHVVVAPISDTEISLNGPMNPIQVQATKVWSPLAFSATGLPGGIAIDPSTGLISGTPTATDDVGVHHVTVTVSDGTAIDTATTSFDLTVSKVLRVDPIADVSAHRGSALTDIPVNAHGGIPGYTYAATGLPAGVTIDAGSGVISGTPTDAVGRYTVRVTVSDDGVGEARSSVSRDFTLVELPPLGGPAAGDPLAVLRINEVKATGTSANDWVELYNTGGSLDGASLSLADSEGDTYQVPTRAIPAAGFVVVDGPALAAAGFDLGGSDTLYLTEADGTVLDQTTWTSLTPTSWARTTDGTGSFGVAAYATKGTANPGPPVINPNDLLVSEVNYDNNSTDWYEYSEITNTTDHPIDFAAYGLTLTKSGAVMTLHDPSDTTKDSPTLDPVIPAHGTQLFWWVENQYFGVKTTAQFRSNYGLAASTPVVLVYGFSSMANSGGDHSFYLSVNQGSTLISRAYVDTPCAANTLNGTSVCPATNNNYAEHYATPADRTNPDAAVWYNSLHSGGDDVTYALKTRLSTPTTVDLEQVGFTRAVKIASVSGGAVTLHNTSGSAVDLSGYVLQKNSAGATYGLPAGTTLAAGGELVVSSATSGLSFAERDYVTLLAPRGYAYSDGLGIADTTGPLLKTLPYDASSGEDPVIDPTTGLPLPPAGGLYRPAGISALNGTVYVSNTGDNVLASIANGSNTIVAGSLQGYGELGNEGPAVDAQLYQPGGVTEDAHGNVFLADSGDNVIREITSDGKIHRFAGTGVAGGDGAAVTATSTPLTVNLWHPNDVAVDGAGNVLIADTSGNRVLEVTPGGAIKVLAGTGRPGYSGDGATGATARLSQPAGVAVDVQDNVYIADSSNNVIRRVDAVTGVITTVAGDYAAGLARNSCLGGYAGDGGPATSALLNDPQGVALDTAGDLFIADTFNHTIRQVAPDGTISTLVNAGAVAGAGNASPVGNGALPATTKLNTPYAVAVDPVTNLVYIADTKNNAIDEVLNAARAGSSPGPIEPAAQVAVTGSGQAGSACAALANGPITSERAPSVTGTRTVGSTLTADPGAWAPTPDSYTYQWLRDGVAIDGATQPTYALTVLDAGHLVAVSATAVKEDYTSTSATSAAVLIAPRSTDPGTPGSLSTSTPTVAGTVRVGAEVSAAAGTWTAGSAAVTAFSYQWLRDGVTIPGATASTYTPTAADYGQGLSVTVTGSYAGYPSASASSAAYPVAAGTLRTARPAIVGKAKVGQRLTAKPGGWQAGTVDLAGQHLTYQWYADGKRIAGATHATYRVARAYRGKRLTVEVTGSYPGYATATTSSKHTRAVTAARPRPRNERENRLHD
jgi:putative Ig domain-containing protein/lamin tail-like protein/NHL repeat-containing protein